MKPAFTTFEIPQRSYNKLSLRLQEFITESQFKSGDKLPPERTLAENFGVSRSSIRLAIRSLAEKGILESRQGDGTYLRGDDMRDFTHALINSVSDESLMFDEVMEFRMIVEPLSAKLAAIRRTRDQLDSLKIIVCDQQRCLLTNAEDGELDALFHQRIAECTGNKLLVATILHLNDKYSAGRISELRNHSWRNFSISSHLRIIDAIERKAPEECHDEMVKHLETVLERHIFSTTRD